MRKTNDATNAFRAECESVMERLSTLKPYTEDTAQFVHNLMSTVLTKGIVCEWDDIKYLVFEGKRTAQETSNVHKKCRGELLMINSACGGYDIQNHSQSENADNVVIGGRELNITQGVFPLWLMKREQVESTTLSTHSMIDAMGQYHCKGGAFPLQDMVNKRGWVIGVVVADDAGSQSQSSQRHGQSGSQLSGNEEQKLSEQPSTNEVA